MTGQVLPADCSGVLSFLGLRGNCAVVRGLVGGYRLGFYGKHKKVNGDWGSRGRSTWAPLPASLHTLHPKSSDFL